MSSTAPGQDGWKFDPRSYRTQEIPADPVTACRLVIEAGVPVQRTSSRYVSRTDPQHRALVIAWQPITPPVSDVDPSAGRADEQHETIIVRPAKPEEIAGLALPDRGTVLVITSTFTLKGIPLGTLDIILASDRCELSYRMPVYDRDSEMPRCPG